MIQAHVLPRVVELFEARSPKGVSPISEVAGRVEIEDGDLWPLPAFSGIVHLLTLTSVEDKRIDSAVLEFTMEEDRYRGDAVLRHLR